MRSPVGGGLHSRTLEEVIGSDCVLVVGGNVTTKTRSPNTCCGMPRGGGRTGCSCSRRGHPAWTPMPEAVVRVQPGGEAASLAAMVAGLGGGRSAVPGDSCDIGAASGRPMADTGMTGRPAGRSAAGRPQRRRASPTS